eukprot:scaffold3296_cov405-Prasinococcus_capsulatus_cf.AAC.13
MLKVWTGYLELPPPALQAQPAFYAAGAFPQLDYSRPSPPPCSRDQNRRPVPISGWGWGAVRGTERERGSERVQ